MSEPQDQRESVVDCSQLTCFEPSRRSAEALRIDHGRLLDEYARLDPVERDHGTEARRQSARRGRCHDCRRELEKLVGLQDHRVPCSTLLASARSAGGRQSEHLAANHAQGVGGGASSAICSRIRRISSRSLLSAASRSTSSRRADRTRRRAAASRSAVRTASESLSPEARTTSSAAAEASSSRTCSDRGICRTVARIVLHNQPRHWTRRLASRAILTFVD